MRLDYGKGVVINVSTKPENLDFWEKRAAELKKEIKKDKKRENKRNGKIKK